MEQLKAMHARNLITVLMPCKDAHPEYFEEAICSVFSQVSSQWQLIVVDDHSTESTILAKLQKLTEAQDPRVRVLKNESRFVTGALNTGMHHATTPFVCSLHCDDLLDLTAIDVLSQAILEFPDIDYFHSSHRYIDDKGREIGKIRRAQETINLEDFKHKGPVKHLHCWRVASARQIGGMDEKLAWHGADDYDFVWCMAEAGCRFKAVAQCLYYYRDHRTHHRLTTHIPLQVQVEELEKIFRKHGMTEEAIEAEIERRSSDYLRQALYLDYEDKARKETQNFDIRTGWRQSHK